MSRDEIMEMKAGPDLEKRVAQARRSGKTGMALLAFLMDQVNQQFMTIEEAKAALWVRAGEYGHVAERAINAERRIKELEGLVKDAFMDGGNCGVAVGRTFVGDCRHHLTRFWRHSRARAALEGASDEE